MFLKKDTAYTTRIGPFLDKTDGVTEETGLTTAAAAIFLSKNGGDFAAKNEASANVHDQDGWYIIIFDATDTNTVGELIVMIQAPATHLPVWKTYYVVEEDTYSFLYEAGSAPDTQIADIKAETVLILADTDDIGVAGAGLTDLGGMSTGMKAEVEVEANDALVGQKLDHLVAAADGDDPVNGSIMAHLVSTTEDWSTFVPLTDSLQSVRDVAPHGSTMVGTDNAALAADLLDKLGAVDEAAAAGDPSTAESVMQYVKQIINILEGADGIGTQKAAAAPGNAVSLSEVIRAIYDDTNAIQGKLPTNKFMGSSDGADDDATLNTIATDAARLTAVRAAVLTDWINGGRLDLLLDALQTDLDNGTDGLGALKALIDTVNSDLANGTDGLGALKTLIDTANSDLANGTDGLGALKALIDSLDTVADAIKVVTDKFAFTVANIVDANTLRINGNADSPVILDRAVRSTTRFTIGAASTTTNIVTSAMDPAAAAIDQFKGLVLKFDKDTTTANLRGQGTEITGNTAPGVLTVTALTTAPVSGDTGTIA